MPRRGSSGGHSPSSCIAAPRGLLTPPGPKSVGAVGVRPWCSCQRYSCVRSRVYAMYGLCHRKSGSSVNAPNDCRRRGSRVIGSVGSVSMHYYASTAIPAPIKSISMSSISALVSVRADAERGCSGTSAGNTARRSARTSIFEVGDNLDHCSHCRRSIRGALARVMFPGPRVCQSRDAGYAKAVVAVVCLRAT